MSKPIRLFKLVTGELVLGKFDEEANMLEDVAIIQVVPTQHGRPRRCRGQVSAHQVALSPLRTKTPPSCPGLFRDGGGEAFPQPRRLRNPSL